MSQRWSPRSFADKGVDKETLRSLFEAARWSASSRNEQPWRFVVATQDKPQGHSALADVLVPSNRRWAVKAPVLILGIARLDFEYNGKPNGHARYDLGAAVTSMLVEATARGLSAHQMAGFDAQKARQTYQIPENFEPVVVVALGHAGAAEALPEELAEREKAPRSRLEQDAIIFEDAFGQSW